MTQPIPAPATGYGELVKEWEREGYDLPLDLRLHADEAEQLHKPSWAMFLRMVADTVVSLQSRADQLAAENARMVAVAGDALGTHSEMRSTGCVDALATWVEGLKGEVARLTGEVADVKAATQSAWDEATEDAKVFAQQRDAARAALRLVEPLLENAWPSIEPDCGYDALGECGPSCELRKRIQEALPIVQVALGERLKGGQ